MAQDIVGGLFGIQQAPDYAAQDYRNAMALAEMNNPNAQGRFLGAMVGAPLGRALGQGVGSLLGVEDPRLKQQKVIASAKQMGFDVTTPEGLQQLASYFVQQGEPGLASQVAQQAQTMSRAGAEEKLKEAQAYAAIKKADAEKIPAKMQELLAAGYTPEQAQQLLRQWINASIEGTSKGSGTTVNLGGMFDKMFTKQQAETEGKLVAEQVDKLGGIVAKTPQTMRNIDTILQVLPDSFTGFGANQLKDLSKALKQAGIPVSDKASNTEILNALTTRFVLDLGKVFPGAQSNYELQTIQSTQPNALQDPRTIKRLLQTAKQDYRIANRQYQGAQQYKKSNQGSFAGFDLATNQAQAGQQVILEDEYNQIAAKATRTGKLTPQEAARAKQLEQQLGIGR